MVYKDVTVWIDSVFDNWFISQNKFKMKGFLIALVWAFFVGCKADEFTRCVAGEGFKTGLEHQEFVNLFDENDWSTYRMYGKYKDFDKSTVVGFKKGEMTTTTDSTSTPTSATETPTTEHLLSIQKDPSPTISPSEIFIVKINEKAHNVKWTENEKQISSDEEPYFMDVIFYSDKIRILAACTKEDKADSLVVLTKEKCNADDLEEQITKLTKGKDGKDPFLKAEDIEEATCSATSATATFALVAASLFIFFSKFF